MTHQEFKTAVKLAETGEYDNVDIDILFGCGLPDFKPVTITMDCAAKFIHQHAMQFNGSWDTDALNEVRQISRRNWLICN